MSGPPVRQRDVRDKARLAVFPDRWQANSFQREFPDARLAHHIAAHD
ncbi:hypothetical protein [Streptomyces sp. NPDC058812]